MSKAAAVLGLLAAAFIVGGCCPRGATPGAVSPEEAELQLQIATDQVAPPPSDALLPKVAPIAERAKALGRGINLGNALDAPSEGEWGVTLRDEDFTLVAAAGFDHVRIPVRWSAHAKDAAPYTIDPAFFARVDWAVKSALAAGLRAIINVHHYDGITKEPDAHKPRLLGIWKQIAAHYQAQPDEVYFELLNEPNDALVAEKNNALIAELLDVVRATNPQRAVIVGSVQWNSVRGLPALKLPEADRNLIVTFHYYDPFDFTHQGAPWVKKENQTGIDWPGSVGTAENIAADFQQAVDWGTLHGRPLYLGEFGAFGIAEMGARERWTKAVVALADRHSLPFAYWELRSGFGAYDLVTGSWREPLLRALLPGPAAAPIVAPQAPTTPPPTPATTN
jgi:endoglucanase